jgi:ABC-type dipeptide/oligopeptide/nickel transport system permease subunit
MVDRTLPRLEAAESPSIRTQASQPQNLWLQSLDHMRRDRAAVLGAGLAGALILLALLAPLLAPYDYMAIDASARLAPPSAAHPLGADELGRDVLSRLLWGTRASLPIALSAVAVATLVGTCIGIVSGFRGGFVDLLIMRAMDILLAFPQLVLALALLAVLGPDIRNLVLALVISSLPGHARVARGMSLSIRAAPYAESARAVGAGATRIMLRYILPNSLSPIIVSATASLGGLILAEAGLSFLGLGIQPPTPSWGNMLNQGLPYLESAPWLTFWPGAAIFLAVLGFNLVGDGIRDAMDPRMRRQ